MVSRYPLDFEAVSKGAIITSKELVEITGHPVGSDQYRLAVLGLKERIEREKAQSGEPVTCAIRQEAIHVLSDPEAAEYNATRFKVNLRAVFRSHGRNLAVDVEQLPDEQRELHLGRLARNGRIIEAIHSARRALPAPEVHQGKLPELAG